MIKINEISKITELLNKIPDITNLPTPEDICINQMIEEVLEDFIKSEMVIPFRKKCVSIYSRVSYRIRDELRKVLIVKGYWVDVQCEPFDPSDNLYVFTIILERAPKKTVEEYQKENKLKDLKNTPWTVPNLPPAMPYYPVYPSNPWNPPQPTPTTPWTTPNTPPHPNIWCINKQ